MTGSTWRVGAAQHVHGHVLDVQAGAKGSVASRHVDVGARPSKLRDVVKPQLAKSDASDDTVSLHRDMTAGDAHAQPPSDPKRRALDQPSA